MFTRNIIMVVLIMMGWLFWCVMGLDVVCTRCYYTVECLSVVIVVIFLLIVIMILLVIFSLSLSWLLFHKIELLSYSINLLLQWLNFI